MNSGYFCLVFSRHLGILVPAAEVVVSRGRKSPGKRLRMRRKQAAIAAMAMLATGAAMAAGPAATALPTGGAITSGSGAISSTAAAMTVQQNTSKMIVKWNTFNIGSSASVNFVQPSSTSAVLNRVDSTGGMSQIYGSMKANGQIYLINPNGIVFGAGSQVNVNTLVASSLDIDDSLFNAGITSKTDGSAVFAGATGFVRVDAGIPKLDDNGKIVLDKQGNVIYEVPPATLAAADGGKIMMFAPTVTNGGVIHTPEGQTLLAAGQKVYLGVSDDPRLRGLLVEVDSGGTTTNLGDIVARAGNVTLAGLAVNQNGRVMATTTVNANGSIKLQARDTVSSTSGAATHGGKVTLGENSVTEILPESVMVKQDDGTYKEATVIDSAKFFDSLIDISGGAVSFLPNAWVVAPSGDVNIYAGSLGWDGDTANYANVGPWVANHSRVYFAAGSGIDVSGVGSGSQAADRAGEAAATVAVGSNIVQAELRSNELADSPLQRSGILYKSKVYVDARETGIDGKVGTSVADVSGYVAQIGRAVKERLADGGAVSVRSEGDVVFNTGATVNVSGGKVEYAGGAVDVTKLVDANGKVVDIADADKSLNYVAIKNVKRQETGYTEGKNGGSATFSAPAMVLGGTVKGDVVAGQRQRTAATRPTGATLQVGQGYRQYDKDISAFVSQVTDINAQTNVLHANIIFDAGSIPVAIAENGSLTNDQKYNLRLGKAFYDSGFGNYKVYADGEITVNRSVNFVMPVFGSVSMTGSGVDMRGNIVVHGGTVALTAKRASVQSDYAGLLDGDGNVLVAAGSLIDVGGVWTNNVLNPSDFSSAVVLNGGSIALAASGKATLGGGNVVLGSGSVLNASGGAWLDSAGKLTAGNGGAIALNAGGGYDDVDAHEGTLTLGGSLRADALLGGKGGSLTLSSGSVAIGSAALGGHGELRLAPAFFTQGGFTSYTVSGYEGVTVENNTAIAPSAYSRILSNRSGVQATGADLSAFSTPTALPATGMAPTRKATSFTLNATTENYGNLTLGEGVSITVDPGAGVSLTGRRQLTVLGDITAHGGSISLAVSQDKLSDGDAISYLNTQSLWLGAHSDLDVSGIADFYVNAKGQRVGKVWDGGRIALNAYEGAVVAQSGATLNLNGASGTVDVLKMVGNRKQYVATTVASTGGSLSVSALESILFDAGMSARGGNAAATGGQFSMSLTSGLLASRLGSGAVTLSDYPAVDGELVLKATGSSVPNRLAAGDSLDSVAGQGVVFADKLNGAEFERVSLFSAGNLRVTENVAVAARGAITLDTPNVMVDNGIQANFRASYIGFGNGNGNLRDNNHAVAVSGTGQLNVAADDIELFGRQTLDGVADARFVSNSDIQMRGALNNDNNDTSLIGELNSAGNLAFSAARIYPSSLSEYTVHSSGSGATVSFARHGNGDTGVPFSALGQLTVKADNIVQGGVLRAPFGKIMLDAKDGNSLILADGSLISISADGETLPFGKTTNGKNWIFEMGSRQRLIDTDPATNKFKPLPDKGIILNGKSVDVAGDARVDISGGGDLRAWEFSAGTGGSADVLAGSGVYAILPGISGGYIPGNSQAYSDTTLQAGDMIYLSGGNGLSAGYYPLLPAHYALLPGAYMVKTVSDKQDMQAFQNQSNTDGSTVMAGYRLQSGGLTADARASGFLVVSGSIVRTQSEFTEIGANDYFKAAYAANELTGYRLPGDAGRLAISAVTDLALNGTLASAHAASARGAEVDITADKIAISNDGTGTSGYLTIDGRQLNAMGAESLLIGGTRSSADAGTAIDVKSSSVIVTGSGNLQGQEILLAATDTVTVQNGATVSASGNAPTDTTSLIIGDSATSGSGDGALLRVSAGEQRTLVRNGVARSQGTLEIASGANVHAKGSMIVDATAANTLNGSVSLDSGGALRLGAPSISFGQPGGAVSGLLFSNAQLAAIGNPSALQLKSYSTLDFYGNVALGGSTLESLALESAGMIGYDNGAVTLTAGTVQFSNPDAAAFAAPATASHGTMTMQADNIVLGQNDFNVAGFDMVHLNADKQVIAQGKSSAQFAVTGDLAIDAARITAASLSKKVIAATGTLTTSASHAATGLASAALGGNLKLKAESITHGGNIDLPSGTVTLQATGAAGSDRLVLLDGSHIRSNGTRQTLGSVHALADGGTINLKADNGNLRMDSGAVLDVLATGGAAAGTLDIDSGGTAVLSGTLSGSAAATSEVAQPTQGSFNYTAASLADFSALNQALETGGFNESRTIRVKSGDMTVAASDTVTAHRVTLTTDDGDLTLAGTINASGSKGGSVALNAGQKAADGKGVLTLASTARIDASATTAATESAGSTGDGGKVLLNVVSDSVTSDAAGSRIDAVTGSVIDVRGKGQGSDGRVTLRAPRTGVASTAAAGNGMAVTAFGSTVLGDHASIVAEGVKVYTGTGNLTINTTTGASFVNMNTVKSNNADFMASNTIASTLGLGGDNRFSVAAGDEIRGAGKITLATDLDLHTWDNGALTVRAAGDLVVSNSVSAGFDTATTAGKLSDGGAWTYRLVAGADSGAADLLATNNGGSGNFSLAAGKLIRTGTGDIGIAAGGNATLASDASAIYTAGRLDTDTHADLGTFTNSATIKFASLGGDIDIAVKGNIEGGYSNQSPALWLYRQGKRGSDGAWTVTSGWWPVVDKFKSQVGALGGGSVTISTRGDINNFAAVTTSNGRVFNATNTLLVQGGGDLTVRAGGDILGGLYMADKGTATIRSDGVIGKKNKYNTAFALGDAKLDVAARDSLSIQAVFNPTLLNPSTNNKTTDQGATTERSYFSTYGANSSVSLSSLAAGVTISDSTAKTFENAIGSGTSGAGVNETILLTFPGALTVTALNGDVTINKSLVLMPSPSGNLQLAANGSLNLNASLAMSDIALADIPTAQSPKFSTDYTRFVARLKTGDGAQSHSEGFLHRGDDAPVVFYAGQDIVGKLNSATELGSQVTLPKKAEIVAGRDILDFSLLGQNLAEGDVTTIRAGRDLGLGTLFKYSDGRLVIQSNLSGMALGGPGYFDVSAGRNIDLGNSEGIVTRGNLANPFLPEAGASLSVLAGANATRDNGFITSYLDPAVSRVHSSELIGFVEKTMGLQGLDIATAWRMFGDMSEALRHQLVLTVFFSELKQNALDNLSAATKSYSRGNRAIAALLPETAKGNVNLAFSQLKTERGGDLNLLAPGGDIVVGLPTNPEGFEDVKQDVTKHLSAASKLGMFTVRGGGINAYTSGSVEVAKSRVFTIGGGDIVMWANHGDIDAGKGSKTAVSAPPPLIRTDSSGNTLVDLSGVVSGSGIGTLRTSSDAPKSDVYLVAPSGTINAGDAGVRSSGNIFVDAARVTNADNFQASGGMSGVPQADAGALSFNVGGLSDSSASAAKSGESMAQQKNASPLGGKESFLPSFITVEVIGFGNANDGAKASDEEDDKHSKKDAKSRKG